MLKKIKKFILNEIKLGKEEYRKQKKEINEQVSETKKVIKKANKEFKDEWNKPIEIPNKKE